MRKTALVTGATSGIGRASTLALARAGFEVFATGRREAALGSLVEEAGGLPIHALVLDVTDAASIARARAEVDHATSGRGLDVLVNNAGYGQFGALEEVSDADFRAQFETNVFGLMAVTRAFLSQMRERGSGRIIHMGSLSGLFTMPLMGVYHATKYAVEALSDAMRVELRRTGVRVVLIEPGMIRTEFEARTRAHGARYSDAESPYGPAMERLSRLTSRLFAHAPGPDRIARLVVKAATARFPAARYRAPWTDRLAVAFVRCVPSWILDRATSRVLRLPVPENTGAGARTPGKQEDFS